MDGWVGGWIRFALRVCLFVVVMGSAATRLVVLQVCVWRCPSRDQMFDRARSGEWWYCEFLPDSFESCLSWLVLLRHRTTQRMKVACPLYQVFGSSRVVVQRLLNLFDRYFGSAVDIWRLGPCSYPSVIDDIPFTAITGDRKVGAATKASMAKKSAAYSDSDRRNQSSDRVWGDGSHLRLPNVASGSALLSFPVCSNRVQRT